MVLKIEVNLGWLGIDFGEDEITNTWCCADLVVPVDLVGDEKNLEK